jgi:4-hydroxybenzoate polyprenyltransferase
MAIQWLRPTLHICHLHRPVDLALLLLPALWTVSLEPGAIHYPQLVALLLAATALRCAAWIYNDLLDATMLPDAPESFISRGLVSRRDGWRLLAGLLTFSTLMLLFLDAAVFLWGGVALGLMLGYPYIKRHTLLTQVYMGLCFAWMVVITQVVSPNIATKILWLLFTSTLLWATANTILYSLPRRAYEERVGLGSMVCLFGDNSGVFVLILQVFAIISLWFVGKQAELGFAFGIALLACLALLPYQQWLLLTHPRSGATRAYRSNILLGVTVLLGLLV